MSLCTTAQTWLVPQEYLPDVGKVLPSLRDNDRVEAVRVETYRPVLSKEGSGTLLRIRVVGTSKEPKFGRDRAEENPEK